MDLRVLTWNVSGGRAIPGDGRDACAALTTLLDGWPWDVALLQDVPPWWSKWLCASLLCEARHVSSSRMPLLGLGRMLAGRVPGLMGAAGGGASAILARSDRIIGERSLLLGRRPGPRVVHGVALACGAWVSNVRVSPGPAAEQDVRAAVRASTEWARAARAPVILGGELGAVWPAAVGPAAGGLRTAAAGADGGSSVLCDARVEIRSETVAQLSTGSPSGCAALAVTLVI